MKLDDLINSIILKKKDFNNDAWINEKVYNYNVSIQWSIIITMFQSSDLIIQIFMLK